MVPTGAPAGGEPPFPVPVQLLGDRAPLFLETSNDALNRKRTKNPSHKLEYSPVLHKPPTA